MFYPKSQLIIKKESFYPDKVVCLGSQLIIIIEFLKKILAPHIWYAADIHALSTTPNQLAFNSSFLSKIGNDLSLIEICSQINQFLSGVFIAVHIQHSIQEIEHLEVRTEDEPFRSLPINGVLIEIRTFDTSFFELYSENENIIKKLAENFNLEVTKSRRTG